MMMGTVGQVVMLRQDIEELVLNAPAPVADLPDHAPGVGVQLAGCDPPPVTFLRLAEGLARHPGGLFPLLLGQDHPHRAQRRLGEAQVLDFPSPDLPRVGLPERRRAGNVGLGTIGAPAPRGAGQVKDLGQVMPELTAAVQGAGG